MNTAIIQILSWGVPYYSVSKINRRKVADISTEGVWRV